MHATYFITLQGKKKVRVEFGNKFSFCTRLSLDALRSWASHPTTNINLVICKTSMKTLSILQGYQEDEVRTFWRYL